jgi:cell division transport system permease protein
MRLGFVLGEMWAGIRNNLSMVVSIILVSFISLTFVSVAALLQLQIGQMKTYWYERAQVAVYLCTDFSPEGACSSGGVTTEQRNAVAAQLKSETLAPYIDTYFFETQQDAYEKFLTEFADVEAAQYLTADQLNEAYWVNLIDPERSDLIVESFSGLDGVEEVRDQRGYLDQIFAFLNLTSLAAGGIAAIMLLSATLLIATTIRLSAFSRRREIGIMKLVGASNFSIQAPFLLEGIIATGIGALLSVGATFAIVRFVVQDILAAQVPFTSFIGMAEAWQVAPYLLLIGFVLAVLASGVSIRRHLKV